MTGVTATDPEDGDLTSSVSVTGSVDTAIAGTYNLTYSVTDSQGLNVNAERVVTVNDVVVAMTTSEEAPVKTTRARKSTSKK